jgi:hypothetical protein
MDEKAIEARKRYMKEWRKKNKDKVKAMQDRYWKNKAKENEENNEEVKECFKYKEASN